MMVGRGGEGVVSGGPDVGSAPPAAPPQGHLVGGAASWRPTATSASMFLEIESVPVALVLMKSVQNYLKSGFTVFCWWSNLPSSSVRVLRTPYIYSYFGRVETVPMVSSLPAWPVPST